MIIRIMISQVIRWEDGRNNLMTLNILKRDVGEINFFIRILYQSAEVHVLQQIFNSHRIII